MIKYIIGWNFKTIDHPNIKTKNGFTAERIVQEYEIEIYEKPGGTVYRNGEGFEITRGDILVAVPGDKRYSKPPFECYSVKFLCDDLELADKIFEISGHHHFEDVGHFVEKTKEIYNIAENINKEIVLDAKIRGLVAEIYEGCVENSTVNHLRREEINCAILFIKNNFQKKITLDDISRHVGLSSSHLHKIFKDIYNMPPGAYLILERINYSKNLLINGTLSVDEIAFKSGFSSRAYFDVTFKKITGKTPSDFRKLR